MRTARALVVLVAGALAARGGAPWCGHLAGAAEAPPHSLAARAQRFPPVTSSRAIFEQEREVSLVDEVLRASGTIEFRAPDHMRLALTTPEAMTIAVDGDTLTVLDAQGTAVAVPPEFSGFTRFGHVLTDLMLGGRGPEQFREEWHGPDAVTLWPDDAAAPFSEIALRFASDGPFATDVVLRERGGDRTTIHLRPLPATASPPARPAS
ncbi:MAG: outer membrane lipoprotein carrier protein LolA [Deltaproteobacteria bacterium]|nr:outer membrane lipoprotein carrier protein LolA [Deltaproteobacteria bacterium]